MNCVKTRFDRVILCAGTMKHCIEILSREMKAPEPGVSLNASPEFTAVSVTAGRLEDTSGTPRYAGVNTESGVTHAVYISFDPDVYELDLNTCFVKVSFTNRDRYFKMKKVRNLGEQDQYIEFECAETGFTDLEAAEV